MVQTTPLNVSSPSPSKTDRVHSQTLRVLSSSQTKIRSLPFELLSAIFQHACPTPDISAENPILMPPFHLVLRLVSTSWYDIVQSTPQFWATVLLPELCAKNVDIKARYLKLYLDTSGGLPLSLSFRFNKGLREVGWFVSSIVDATLEHSAPRIQALRLSRPPRIWLENLIPKMCQLATIHIDNPRPEKNWSLRRDERLFLPKSANIRQIYLRCPCLLDLRLACATPSLTHVDIIDCPIDFAMEFLLRFPNLIDFRCRCLSLYPLKVENPRTMFTSPLIRSHLSTFSWSTNFTRDGISEWDSVLFELIRFPSLERFHWWAGACQVIVDDTILAFLSRIPKSISILELGEVDMTFTDVILNHFLLLTGVTQLRLCHCNCSFVEQVFSICSRGTDGRNILFPKLTSIIIEYRVTGEWTPPWMVFRPESGKKLAEMLRTRIGLIDEFKLVVEGVSQLTRRWNGESWQAVRDVTRDGLDLTIIENGFPVIMI